MLDDKLVKKEVLFLLISVILLFLIIGSFSFAYFMSIDKGEYNVINVGDLNISFCEDEHCKSKYSNYGNVIGTKIVDGINVVENVYPYISSNDALLKEPYIFNIKNSGKLKTYVTIYLKEDKDYTLKKELNNYKAVNQEYTKSINLGIVDCSDKIDRSNVNILNYYELENNIILENDVIDSNEDKTYCLWTWLDENTSNDIQGSYFVANLDFKAEYIPE